MNQFWASATRISMSPRSLKRALPLLLLSATASALDMSKHSGLGDAELPGVGAIVGFGGTADERWAEKPLTKRWPLYPTCMRHSTKPGCGADPSCSVQNPTTTGQKDFFVGGTWTAIAQAEICSVECTGLASEDECLRRELGRCAWDTGAAAGGGSCLHACGFFSSGEAACAAQGARCGWDKGAGGMCESGRPRPESAAAEQCAAVAGQSACAAAECAWQHSAGACAPSCAEWKIEVQTYIRSPEVMVMSAADPEVNLCPQELCGKQGSCEWQEINEGAGTSCCCWCFCC